MFDHHLLDMVEIGIANYKPMDSCEVIDCNTHTIKIICFLHIVMQSHLNLLCVCQAGGSVLGSKPCLLFAGDCFETEVLYIRIKNIFIGRCAVCYNTHWRFTYIVIMWQTFFVVRRSKRST